MECLDDDPNIAYWKNVSILFNETMPWCDDDTDCNQYGQALLHTGEKPGFQLRLFCRLRKVPAKLINKSVVGNVCQPVQPSQPLCICNEYQALSGPGCQQNATKAFAQTILIIVSSLYGIVVLVSIQRQFTAAPTLSDNKKRLIRACTVLTSSVLLSNSYAVLELHFIGVREAHYELCLIIAFLFTLLLLCSSAFVGLFYISQVLELLWDTLQFRDQSSSTNEQKFSLPVASILKSVARAKVFTLIMLAFMGIGYVVAIVRKYIYLAWGMVTFGCVTAAALHFYVPWLFTKRVSALTIHHTSATALVFDPTIAALEQMSKNVSNAFNYQGILLLGMTVSAGIATFSGNGYVSMIVFLIFKLISLHYARVATSGLLSLGKVDPNATAYKISRYSTDCGTLNG